MKAGKWVFIGLGFLASVLPGCKKSGDENNCIGFTNAPVTKVEGPTTGNVNQAIDLTVSFGCFSGCGQFGNFEQTANGNSTTISVVAKYEGCICTTEAPIRQTIYNFKAGQPGTYYLRFEQTKDSYLTYSIVIQ